MSDLHDMAEAIRDREELERVLAADELGAFRYDCGNGRQ